MPGEKPLPLLNDGNHYRVRASFLLLPLFLLLLLLLPLLLLLVSLLFLLPLSWPV